MITEFLEGQATLYASQAMNAQERERFELVLEFHQELRELVTGLEEAGAALILASTPSTGPVPSERLKDRILNLTTNRRQQTSPEGLVVCGPDTLVQWVNPAFSAMCGYTLEELQGKKLGPILQGADTDRETAARMGRAVRACQPCRETILNYHKNGTPYWVEVAITPILGEADEPLWLVARERELHGRVAA
jgi:PAS domain S-box-containing protein